MIAIHEGDLETAEQKLEQAARLLKSDSYEYSLDKDVYLNYSYAKLYESQQQYDKALDLYQQVAASSLKRGLGFEEQVYYEIAGIYKKKKDMEHYVTYLTLYTEVINSKRQSFSSEYIVYSQELYDYNTWKKKEHMKKVGSIITGLFLFLTFVYILFFLIKWRKKSCIDHMTHLYTRTYLQEYMKRNRKRLMNRPLAVIMTDINYFKQYNDHYGHLQGDHGIKMVANALVHSVRKSDLVIRYGWEEMLIIIPNSTLESVENIARRIQENIAEKKLPHAQSKVSDYLTVSMGIYLTQYTGEDIFELVKHADDALYQAKNAGRNRYKINAKQLPFPGTFL